MVFGLGFRVQGLGFSVLNTDHVHEPSFVTSFMPGYSDRIPFQAKAAEAAAEAPADSEEPATPGPVAPEPAEEPGEAEDPEIAMAKAQIDALL